MIRDDDAYFEPLRDLKLPAETEFYLGLVHLRMGWTEPEAHSDREEIRATLWRRLGMRPAGLPAGHRFRTC